MAPIDTEAALPSVDNDVLGFLYNDMNGLCITKSGQISSAKSDAYTSLARIASRLTAGYSTTGDDYFHLPVVTIETNNYTLIVKEHDVQEGGLTVVMKVPPASRNDVSSLPTSVGGSVPPVSVESSES
uniref:Late endosomal/lysosomal adaptor and MAPK and MTOR activator 5 n=1 Tax=Corethron hystrix TaxID=216773 RepID=A0A7S1BV49_9STRA|mmetsp:Transcript_411/g.849  ORF Transcript_411/g.849 Transcript_411/m.849 type:complete len:128 (+) Transcript_411:37-420(+)